MNDTPIGFDGALLPHMERVPEQRTPFDPSALNAVPSVPPLLDPELQVAHALPREHPAWTRDVLSISTRARAVIAKLKPIAVKVLSFWDHRIRELRIGDRKLNVDASGSYRLMEAR